LKDDQIKKHQHFRIIGVYNPQSRNKLSKATRNRGVRIVISADAILKEVVSQKASPLQESTQFQQLVNCLLDQNNLIKKNTKKSQSKKSDEKSVINLRVISMAIENMFQSPNISFDKFLYLYHYDT
jgi:hypothetical protein